jgi:acetyltransferase-like isoleucine patch superfamily enzyme
MKDLDKNEIIRERLRQGKTSPVRTYMDMTTGSSSYLHLMRYELITSFLGPLAGAVGFFFRKIFYPGLFKSAGSGLIIGRNVTIRHAGNIVLGNDVTIDDNCLIDARGAGEQGIIMEDGVIVNRGCAIQAKAGYIRIGKRTSLGANSVVVSQDGVDIGEAVLTAGGISISTGLYHFGQRDLPVMDQGAYTKGPVHVGRHSWLGSGVMILDGVSLGEGVVVGAGSVVNKDIPAFAVSVGVPAKVLRFRE